MAFRMSTPLKKAIADNVILALAGTYGTDGTASLRIYDGTQAVTPDAGTAGTVSTNGNLLVVINGIGWDQATNGTAYFANGTAATSGYYGTAITSGTATWARLECINANGTCRMDGDIGTSGANVFTINASVINKDDAIHLISANIYTL